MAGGVPLPISQLPAASTLTGSEIVPITQLGTTVKTSTAAIAALGGYPEPLNVRAYGAVGDGVTDDTAAVQTALAAALAVSPTKTVFFPAGTYLCGKLVYSFQNLVGEGQNSTIIQGKPGQDVFYAPDPSISESGYVMTPTANVTVQNLSVFTDSSGSPAFTRPVYPILEAWTTGHTYHVSQYVTNGGNVYVMASAGINQINSGSGSGTAGATGPTHTVGVASDGALNWLYVDSSTPNVQNCAFAFPCSTGNPAVGGAWVTWLNVTLKDNAAGTNNTCGVFSQRSLYAARFVNCRLYPIKFGIIDVAPTANWQSTIVGSDTCSLTNVDFSGVSGGGSYPFVSINGNQRNFSMCSFYTAHTNDKAFYILPLYDSRGSEWPNMGTFTQMYCEGGTAGQQFILLTGGGHVINSISPTVPTGAYITIASDGTVINSINTTAGNNSIQVWGNHNKIVCASQTNPYTTVNDQGRGNQIETAISSGIVNTTERQYSNANRRRRAVNEQTPFFILNGFDASPIPNEHDLMFGARECLWISPGVNSQTTDNTLETGGYVTLPINGLYWQNAWSNVPILFGTHIPASKGRVYFKARSTNSVTSTGALYAGVTQLELTNVATSTQTFTINAALTTSWQIFSFDYDATSYSGQNILFSFGNATYTTDLAWVCFRPVGFNTLAELVQLCPITAPTTTPKDPNLGYGFYLYVDAADGKLKAKGSGGTVTNLASP